MDRSAKTLPKKAIKKTLALGFPRRLPGQDKPPTSQTDYTQKFVLSRINYQNRKFQTATEERFTHSLYTRIAAAQAALAEAK